MVAHCYPGGRYNGGQTIPLRFIAGTNIGRWRPVGFARLSDTVVTIVGVSVSPPNWPIPIGYTVTSFYRAGNSKDAVRQGLSRSSRARIRQNRLQRDG